MDLEKIEGLVKIIENSSLTEFTLCLLYTSRCV